MFCIVLYYSADIAVQAVIAALDHRAVAGKDSR